MKTGKPKRKLVIRILHDNNDFTVLSRFYRKVVTVTLNPKERVITALFKRTDTALKIKLQLEKEWGRWIRVGHCIG